MRKLSDNFGLIFEQLKYILLARYKNGHGVHSPIVYEFVSKVLYNKQSFADYKKIEKLVQLLKADSTELEFVEMGGGSRVLKGGARRVKDIVLSSAVKKKYGRLLFRIVRHYEPDCILELGTSLGISSLYLAMASKKVIIHTVEGNSSVVENAKENAKSLGVSNIQFYCGNFQTVLPELLNTIKTPTLVYVDGNHTYNATINYYRQISKKMKKGIIIFDDIYWSDGMKKAWQEIVANENVTIDIFQFGIVMLGDMLTPGHYKVRF